MIENDNKKNIIRVIEALIFASTKPVSAKELSPYLEEFELNDIIEIIEKKYSRCAEQYSRYSCRDPYSLSLSR